MAKSMAVEDLGHPIDYDPHFKGPLKNRSCTDIICLLLLMVFIVCWIGVGVYALKFGDPNKLLLPKDSHGRICGLDEDVKNTPYLFFFDLTKCAKPNVLITGCQTPQKCVEKCPENFWAAAINKTESDQKFCVDKNCPEWYVPSKAVQNRCIPDLSKLDDIKDIIDVDAIEKAIKNVNLLTSLEQTGQIIVKDITSSWLKILVGVGIAVCFCILYIVLLRFLAGIMVWFSLFAMIALLSAGVYFSARKYKDEMEYADADKTKKDLWLAALIIASVVLAIVLLIIIFLRKRILLAIALIKEGSKAVGSVTSVLFFPIVPWLLQIAVIAYAVIVAMYLASTGEAVYKAKNITNCGSYKDNDVCYPANFTCPSDKNAACQFVSITNPPLYPYLQLINVFGMFWLAFFASALGQMILASVFAQWYWTFKKSKLPFFALTTATGRTLRYHIGTLAFGSLIIAICRMIRVCLEYVDHKLKKYDNEITKAILCCLKCFFWCLEKFLKFINKNAYIMCAIHGKNFCASAKDAFFLLMRNILRVFVLDKVTDFLFFVSKLVITLGIGALAYLCFVTDLTIIDNSNIQYGEVPVAILMAITYLIASVFFNVYSMAVDTLFLCFLEDCERNDGSTGKPYYMSKNLMKIFGKKNKRS